MGMYSCHYVGTQLDNELVISQTAWKHDVKTRVDGMGGWLALVAAIVSTG